MSSNCMDESLIDEVAHHGVIYNRQKYYLNGNSNGNGSNKYETKDEAWQIIAMKLRTDVETCKKRWKYLRERYVSQRKQGDPPVYEHLSRPYLEKMKFLDQHIQPRKSYRNVPNFLTSPHSAHSSNFGEYNMDSSKSSGSLKNIVTGSNNYYQSTDHAMAAAAASVMAAENGGVKIEADQVFRDFAAAVASQQLQHISQSQMHQNYQEQFRENMGGNSNGMSTVATGGGLTSSSSSMKSPLSSPLATSVGVNGIPAGQHNANSDVSVLPSHNFNNVSTEELDSASTSSNYHMKKPRVHLNSHMNISGHSNIHNQNTHNNVSNNTNASTNAFVDESDDDSDDNNSNNILHPQTILNETNPNTSTDFAMNSAASLTNTQRHANNQHQLNNVSLNSNNSAVPANADFLFQLYQTLPHQQTANGNTSLHHGHHQTHTHHHGNQHQHFNKFQVPQTPQRSSEHLLGELVTTELLKMSKERRKHVQKRILEILFFDD